MRKLSAGDALRVASQSVSIWGAGAHWTVCYPWDKRDPAGPNTTHTCTSYGMARLSAARIKANIALALLGLYDNDTAPMCIAPQVARGNWFPALCGALCGGLSHLPRWSD